MLANKNLKRYNVIQLIVVLAIIIVLNFLSQFLFKRFDLTAEKRFTLSVTTKDFLKNLDDVVYIKIYLEGEFPAGFKRLRNETKEMLDEFRAYAGDNIQYEFINPSSSPDQKARNEVYQNLSEKGLQPTNLQQSNEDGNSQQIIFPGAILSYRGTELPLMLLKSQIGVAPELMLNNSINDLEYELISTIKKLQIIVKPKVAFIQGHGELAEMEVADITHSLEEYYEVKRVTLNGSLNALKGYRAIIIAKPDSAFDEKDKFVIDQFIMHGGKVAWLIDPVIASMDSLSRHTETIGLATSFNIEDQLFRYGVRINTNLVQDIQCVPIPIISGYVGNQPQTRLYPWMFYPLIFQTVKHPIVNNLNAVKLEFASTIDTVGNSTIKKTVLLTTSRFSRLVNTPARINLNMAAQQPEEKLFNRSFQPVAVLLEGIFESNYKNRVPPTIAHDSLIDFKEKSVKPTKMIVVSDGDIIKNYVHKASGKIAPLGYDKYTREQYGNKNFLLNAINYLCDDSGLLELRNKEVKLRLLDKTKLKNERTKWQLINVIMPVVLVVLMGIVLFYVRKRKYSK